MLIDNFVGAVMHVVYTVMYGMVYVGWSKIYYYMDPDTHVLYPKLLDWNYPEITIPVIPAVLFFSDATYSAGLAWLL